MTRRWFVAVPVWALPFVFILMLLALPFLIVVWTVKVVVAFEKWLAKDVARTAGNVVDISAARQQKRNAR